MADFKAKFESDNPGKDTKFGEVQTANIGAPGLSAYEIAVKNGFAGTEQEWLDSLKGAKGDPGDSIKGDPGYTPVKGIDYFDGQPGVSATHKWDGTVLTITSASGTSSADLKGKQGDPGKTPEKGVDYFDGKTPEKGTDYFTEADKTEMVAAVKALLTTEQWTFTLKDGTQLTKAVYVGD